MRSLVEEAKRCTPTTFDDAASGIGGILEKLPPAEQVRMLGLAAGFALSLIGAGDRQQARDRLVALIDHTSRDAVLSRCDG